MKRFFMLTACLIIILCSCQRVDNYELDTENEVKSEYSATVGKITFVANTSTFTYHLPDCYIIRKAKEENKLETKDIDYLTSRGYKPCKNCMK